MTYTAQTNGITKSNQPMSAFAITETNGQFVVTLDSEWIATYGTMYGANLHIACIAA